jgi:hypothetical protein
MKGVDPVLQRMCLEALCTQRRVNLSTPVESLFDYFTDTGARAKKFKFSGNEKQ